MRERACCFTLPANSGGLLFHAAPVQASSVVKRSISIRGLKVNQSNLRSGQIRDGTSIQVSVKLQASSQQHLKCQSLRSGSMSAGCRPEGRLKVNMVRSL